MAHPQPIKNHPVYHIPISAQNSLPENIIIDLHEMFLTNGIHRIKIANQQSGRKIINTLLRSLNYYQDIGFLSLDKPPEDSIYHDLYPLFNKYGYLDRDGNNHKFDQFFSEAFFFDFMIIEVTDQLKDLPWFTEFLNTMTSLAFDVRLPIVLVGV